MRPAGRPGSRSHAQCVGALIIFTVRVPGGCSRLIKRAYYPVPTPCPEEPGRSVPTAEAFPISCGFAIENMDHLVLQRQLKLADFALFLLILHGTAALPLATTQDCPAASGSWTFRPRDPASAGSRGPASTTRHSSSSHVFLAVEEGKIGEKWLDYAERIGGAVHEEGELALPARFGDAAEVALCRGRLVGGQRALVAVKRDPRLEVY